MNCKTGFTSLKGYSNINAEVVLYLPTFPLIFDQCEGEKVSWWGIRGSWLSM